MPVGFTPRRSVQGSGFDDPCRLTPTRRLYPLPVGQASALLTASSGLSVARETLAARLTLPLARRVEDLHLQVSAPCRAHKTKRAACAALRETGSLNPKKVRVAKRLALGRNAHTASKPQESH